jgi:hypothetical protein
MTQNYKGLIPASEKVNVMMNPQDTLSPEKEIASLLRADSDQSNPAPVATGQGERLPDTPEENHRQSRVINRDYVKRWALDYAHTNRCHHFTRDSEQFLNAIETATKAAIRDKIDRHPSKGKTLM